MTGFSAIEGRDYPKPVSAIAFAIGLMVAITSAAAQDAAAQDSAPTPPIPTAPDQEPSLYNYGTVDRTCLNWSDGCRTCSYDKDLSLAICSNVGIACEPRELICVARQPDAEKK